MTSADCHPPSSLPQAYVTNTLRYGMSNPISLNLKGVKWAPYEASLIRSLAFAAQIMDDYFAKEAPRASSMTVT